MRFADPWILLLIPVGLVLLILRYRKQEGHLKFSSVNLLKTLRSATLWEPRRVNLFLRAAVITLLVVAAARPQSGKKFTEVTTEGVDIILALDTSGSMRALDLMLEGKRVPRVDVVKKVAGDFIDLSPHDRIGIVVFGENAFLQSPLTLDHNVGKKLLDSVQVGIAGDSTSIGDAIAISVNHMKDLKAKSKVVVLLTDGQNNSGVIPPIKAAEIAKNFHIKIYTIGVGIDGQAPFLVDTPIGKQVVYQRADLDEPTLQQIANITGGNFYRAKDSDTLAKVYAEIGRLEKTKETAKEYQAYNELYASVLLLGLMLLVLEIVLGQTLLRKVP